MFVVGIALGIGIVFIGLGWWLINVTEGVYLGPRVVGWLYDRFADRYDQVKNTDPVYERTFISNPLLTYAGHNRPFVLDVATGTGRVPLSLIEHPRFDGAIVGIDISIKMLTLAAYQLAPEMNNRVWLLEGSAEPLDFSDNTFDVTCCLEALEFLPAPMKTLKEIVRVTRPGGIIVVTNRQGKDAWMFPGKTMSNLAFQAMLEDDLQLQVINFNTAWSDLYALVWARKPGNATPSRLQSLGASWRCRRCQSFAWHNVRTTTGEDGWQCLHCNQHYQQYPSGIIKIERNQ